MESSTPPNGYSMSLPMRYPADGNEPVQKLYATLSRCDDNGHADASDSDEEIEAALEKPGANGIPVWQSYFLGLEPDDPASVVLCEAAESQPVPGTVAVVAKNLAVPAGLEGVTVTAYLDRKSMGGEWVNGVDIAQVPASAGGTATLSGALAENETMVFLG